MLRMTCASCGEVFYIRAHEKRAKASRGKYCSDRCSGEAGKANLRHE
jgi:hypothetical protein